MTDDPGWGRPRDIALGAVAPQLALRRASGPGEQAPVVALRILSVSFAAGLLLIAVVTLFVTSGGSGEGAIPTAPASVGAGLLAVAGVAVGRTWRATLTCGPADEVVSAFRVRFLLRLALCEGPAMVGFVLAILTGSPLPYLAALPIALVGIALDAPTATRLRAEDERLALAGCGTSLHDALVGASGPAEPV
ncbi:MAG: hypothetical protein KDB04_05850 [Acidimicrobiales bacterium]|nr:hypothetical protein [Acidimicrobiales bacterium]